MHLKESLESFLKKRYALPLIVILTLAVDTLLLTAGTCLTTVLIALLTFAIPYYAGLRNVKKFLLIGLLAFLVITAAWPSVFLSQTPGPVNSPATAGDKITGATVTPYRGSGETAYNFTATVYLVNNRSNEPTAYLNYISLGGNDTKTVRMNAVERGGGIYDCYYETTLPEGVYYFAINMSGTDGNVSTYSRSGPINADYGAAYMALLMPVLKETVVMFLLYFILVMIFWWGQKAREEKRKKYPEPELDASEDEEIFYCSNCGAPVKKSDRFCPKCGEILEDDEESEEEVEA